MKKQKTIREPFLTPFIFYKNYQRRTFGYHEKQYGVTENIFTKKEWENMLKGTGFKINFIKAALRADGNHLFKNMIKKILLLLHLDKFYLYFRPNYFIILEKYSI